MTQANSNRHPTLYVRSFTKAFSHTSVYWPSMGKYEVTGRLSGRTAATGIFLSPTQTAPLAATALVCRRESAGEPGRGKSPVAESEGGSG